MGAPAAPGLPPRQVAQGQAVVHLSHPGKTEEEIAARIELRDRPFDAVARGEPVWSNEGVR